MEYTTNKVEETLIIAQNLAKSFTGGEIVLLKGELGAGKTVFAKGIAKGLSITDTITSPTFTIMNEYKGRLTMYHFDMYRLNGESSELGFEEYYGLDNSVCVIEWNTQKYFDSPKVINIDIEYLDENARRIVISEDIMR